MVYAIKLKTGFYETTLYNLAITDKHIQLNPVSTGNPLIITHEELVAFSIRNSEVEIITRTQVYYGTLILA